MDRLTLGEPSSLGSMEGSWPMRQLLSIAGIGVRDLGTTFDLSKCAIHMYHHIDISNCYCISRYQQQLPIPLPRIHLPQRLIHLDILIHLVSRCHHLHDDDDVSMARSSHHRPSNSISIIRLAAASRTHLNHTNHISHPSIHRLRCWPFGTCGTNHGGVLLDAPAAPDLLVMAPRRR